MAELVDALGSGSSRRTPVRVRVPLAADNFLSPAGSPLIIFNHLTFCADYSIRDNSIAGDFSCRTMTRKQMNF